MLCCHIAFLPPPPDKQLLKMFMAVAAFVISTAAASDPVHSHSWKDERSHPSQNSTMVDICAKQNKKRKLALSHNKVAMKKYYVMKKKWFAMFVWSLKSRFSPCGREKTFWFFRSFVCVHINVASFIYFFLKIFFICSNVLCVNNFLDMKHLCRIFMLMFVLCEIYYNVFYCQIYLIYKERR